jgi:predicted DsbA family dithiol-disulfide isomerase
MAVESPHITADVVEISEFRDLAERYAITGVPKTVFNDQMELLGAQPESTLVNAVVQAAD